MGALLRAGVMGVAGFGLPMVIGTDLGELLYVIIFMAMSYTFGMLAGAEAVERLRDGDTDGE